MLISAVFRAFLEIRYHQSITDFQKGSISATPNHPVFISRKGFLNADTLSAGMKASLLNGKRTKRVKIISINKAPESVSQVYNLKTSLGNYFANGVLVHNK